MMWEVKDPLGKGLGSGLSFSSPTSYHRHITRQLEERVLTCDTFQWHRKALHTEPLIDHDIACKPYHKIRVDLFEFNHEHYLLSVDYYSKYPEVTLLSDTSSPSVINTLKENFARNRIPHIVVSDNGQTISKS